MEFRASRPIRVGQPPEQIEAHPVRQWCERKPVVAAGQPVRQGQPLVIADAGGRGCVSQVTGTVRQVTPAQGGDADGGAGWVTIDPSGEHIDTQLVLAPPRDRTLDDWFGVLDQVGPWGGRDGGVGLSAQLRAARQKPPQWVVCMGLDTFPPYPVRSSLLRSFPDDVVLGTLILADVVGARQSLMLASQHPSVLSKLRVSCKNFNLPLIAQPSVYPCADPTLVVWSHVPGRRRLTVGANPVGEVGVMLIDPWTAIRVARWFTHYKLDLARPMMVAWPRSGTPMTVRYALVGQPLGSLDDQLATVLKAGGPVIFGNPMADRLVSAACGSDSGELVVPGDELLVTVIDRLDEPQPEPCISCGWCVDVCPTGLRPNQMFELCGKAGAGPALNKQLSWCIDCGLCSHVCPSSLPLAQSFRRAGGGGGVSNGVEC